MNRESADPEAVAIRVTAAYRARWERGVRPDASFMKKRVHVYYSGRVQGVGFRVTAEELASPLGGVGWVKNLRDGRVELVGEAEEEALAQFLDALRTGSMRNFVQRVDVTWSAATDGFREFEIRYY